MRKPSKKVRNILAYQFITMVIFNMAHPVTPTLITTLEYPTYAFGFLFATIFKIWNNLPFILSAVIFGITGIIILINKAFLNKVKTSLGN